MFIEKFKMMNKKLKEIGQKLNITDKDIKNIQKENRKRSFLHHIIIPVIGAVTIVCSTIVGFLLGSANPPCINCGRYPYAGSVVIPGMLSRKKKKCLLITIIVTGLLSIAGFVIAYKTAQNMFGRAMMYNVYKR